MTESHRVAPQLLCRRVKRAAPHLGAERARIFFFSYVEYYPRDFGRHYRVGNVKLVAKLTYPAEIRTLKAHIDGYGAEIKFFWVEASQIGKRTEQSERILTRRYTHGYLISVAYHFVIVNGAPCIA